MARRRADPEGDAAAKVTRALNEQNAGLNEHKARCDRYDRAYRVWRSPENPEELRGRPAWKPLLKVKYGMQTVDQATISIVQGVPAPKCIPRRPEAEDAAKAMGNTLSYYGDISHLAEEQDIVAQQALVYGVSPGKTRWLYKEIDQRKLAPVRDPQSGEVLWQPGVAKIVQTDRPDFQPWDVYDCWWDPLAPDPEKAAYVTLRCWPSKDELLGNAYNDDTKTGMYRNLEMLFSKGPGGQRPQSAQNELLGQPSYRDRFEVWEIWRDQRLTVIGNKQVLLYDGPSPYWMPGKPVTISNTRPDFFRIEGVSETELVDHIQQTLHAEDNLRLENLRFTVQRGATVRETVPDMKQLVMQPHFLWPVTDHDDVRFVDQPGLPPEAYREHETLMGLMQFVTGITPYVSGASAGATGTDQNTATGVSILANAGSRLLAYKAQRIASRTYLRMWQQWSDLTHQFLRSPIAVAIEGPGEEKTWVQYGPQDVYGDFDVRIEAAEESLNKQQRRADAVALLNALAPFAAQGLIDPKPLLRQVAEAFGFPSAEALFPVAQPQPQAAPQGLLGMPTANGNGQVQAGAPPLMLGGQITPQPAMAVLRGRASG